MSKTLVLYVFHQYNNRVEYFLKNCLLPYENVDFVVICNSQKITFTVPPYVKKILRDNIGFDFGGWSHGLLHENAYTHYDRFIFVNSSVMGPFLTDKNKKWTDIYLDELKDNIKLFGSTINTCNDPLHKSHIQSYIFAMDRTTLEYLIQCEIFSLSNLAKNMNEAIWNKEVLMSRKIIEKGWNIGSHMKQYKGIDFTFSNKKPHEYDIKFLADILYSNTRNILWNEYDLVFIKGNRVSNIIP